MSKPLSGLCGWLSMPLTIARDLFQERRCLSCARVYVPGSWFAGAALCRDCARQLPRREGGFCPGCGEVFAWPDLPLTLCRFCLERPPPFHTVFFHGVHEGLLRRLLLDIKFNNQIALAHALGGLLGTHPAVDHLFADVIIPVPLHPERLRQRGFNQSLELARPMAGRLGIPLRNDVLVRKRKTASQTGLNREKRRMNTQGAFHVQKDVSGLAVLLVDDVMTTGATLASAAFALQAAGAGQVSAAAISRAPFASLLRR